MNERIKQLAEQAGMTDDKYGMFFAKDFDSHCADGVDLEKFAQLIIRECAGLVQGVPTDTMGYHTADQKIKEHFGVKE